MFLKLIVILATLHFTEQSKSDQCHDNEIYYECGRGADDCSNDCTNLNEAKSPYYCKEYCVSGCRCASGYAWNSIKQCIPSAKCSACTRSNEEYRINLSTSCDIPTCDNPNIIYERPLMCTRDSRSDCVCINQTVRNENGDCVKPEECANSNYF